MTDDEKLVERIRDVLSGAPGLSERKMFGGICFAIDDHIACGVFGKELVVRVGPENYEYALSRTHARAMDFTGKIPAYVIVHEAGYKCRATLEDWLLDGIEYVRTLPPMISKKK